MVRFPSAESDSNTIRFEGRKAVVEKIIAAIEEIIQEKNEQITSTLDIPQNQHRLIIGRGGETRRDLESKLKVSIDVPKQGHNSQKVKVTGKPADVEKAQAHILDMVKGQEGETVQVPRHLHHTISNNTQFFRRLQRDHGVKVDHAGHKIPSKPSANGNRTRTNGGDLPLITDDADASASAFSWEIYDASTESGEQGDIPWILRGKPDGVAKARGVLEAALKDALKPSSTGYLILPDPSKYRFVIGPGGKTITSIREQTGCTITVPRDQAQGEAIEIVGSREGVEDAKDFILDLVREGGNGGRK
jgi:rRNA processing protein Krr1/Pno1